MDTACFRALSVFCLGLSALALSACSDGINTASNTNDGETRAAKSAAVERIIEANRQKALGNHHDHMAANTNLQKPASRRVQTPDAPEYARQFDGQYRPIRLQQGRVRLSNDLGAKPPALHAENCVLDFATSNLMHYETSGTTYWADRTYIPWLRDCGGNSRLDLRWSKYGHMHVGFTDPDITFCFSEPDASPAYKDDQGNCELLDINNLERSYVTSHGWDEVLVLRANYLYDSTWTAFDLKRIRVVRETGARVCYRKAGEPDSEGPWIISGDQGTGTSSSMPGGWYCWKHLGQGNWDLSAWADDVIAVKITSSARTPSTFAIDDIHAVVH